MLDRIMAGQYPNLVDGAKGVAKTEGLRGFYRGWQPAMGSKIPSYALTWTFFQQFKRIHERYVEHTHANKRKEMRTNANKREQTRTNANERVI